MCNKNNAFLFLLILIMPLHAINSANILKELKDLLACVQKGNCSKQQKLILAGGIIGIWLGVSGGAYCSYRICKRCCGQSEHIPMLDEQDNAITVDHNAETVPTIHEKNIDFVLSNIANGIYPADLAQKSEKVRFQLINKMLEKNQINDDHKKEKLLAKHFAPETVRRILKFQGVRFVEYVTDI